MPTVFNTLQDNLFDFLSDAQFDEMISIAELAALTIVLYREGDADSYDFATYYAAIHNIPDENILSVPCSENEILADYATFQTEIETPLINQISNEYGLEDYRVIIVGYNVPGGFYDESDIICTQSRLARIGHSYTKQLSNPLFSPAVYHPYSVEAADEVKIVSRIDAPTLEIAKGMVDRMRLASRQTRVNGEFFFDNDAIIDAYDEYDEYGTRESYSTSLTEFETLTLPRLNLTTTKTYHWADDTDVPLWRLEDDSFSWSWQTDRCGYTFFKDSKPTRFFLYNADNDGGASMRDIEERRWPLLALSSGYVATGGAMSDPTPDGYLRPRPFFESLLVGASLGEAFILACPYLDWSVGMFGDPLMIVKFPFGDRRATVPTADEGFLTMKDSVAEAVGFFTARRDAYSTIHSIILNSSDFEVKTELYPGAIFLRGLGDRIPQTLSPFCKEFCVFGAQQSNLESYLTAVDTRISSLVASLAGQFPSSSLTYDQGFWSFTTTLTHESSAFRFYHFELIAAYDVDYTDVIIHSTTDINYAGGGVTWEPTFWEYEKEQSSFVVVPSGGVPSSFEERRVRCNGSVLLDRGQMYYVKYRQIDNLNQTTDWVEAVQAVGT